MTASRAENSVADLQAIYGKHPLRLSTIMARLTRQGASLEGLTELSLAVDDETGVTDQNHVGGSAFVRELASVAQVERSSTVADVGCGLGGSARLLAHEFGCRVVGIEMEPQRYREAVELTGLVGLNELVTILHDDAESMEPLQNIDVLWGQGAWFHFRARRRFMQRWCGALPPGGRMAIEDIALRRVPPGDHITERLRRLEDIWKGSFVPLDEWRDDVLAAECDVALVKDLSGACRADMVASLELSRTWPPGTVDPLERPGWELARDLFDDGSLTYFRLVARKRDPADERAASGS